MIDPFELPDAANNNLEEMKMRKENIFPVAMVASGCFALFLLLSLVAMAINTSETQRKINQQNEQTFFERCAAACSPNDVYSTKYNRCSCNAAVIVKQIK